MDNVKNKMILITGVSGMLGSCLYDELFYNAGCCLLAPTHNKLDLLDKNATIEYFKEKNIDIVLHCAALVGGILKNKNNQEEFMQKNIEMQDNIIEACFHNECELYFMSSSCCYPKNCIQPMPEEMFFEGEPEPTNAGYALAKRNGVKKINDYNKLATIDRLYKGESGNKFKGLSLHLCNLYGNEQHFDAINSHVIPALFKKFSQATGTVELLGSGNAEREFLFAEDAARLILEIMEERIIDKTSTLNVGSNVVISIKELADIIKKVTGFKHDFVWSKKDDGMNKKTLDISKLLSYNIKPAEINMWYGIALAYRNFLEKKNKNA